ncbi:MAG: hypothetical protein ACTHJ4_00580 [Candidatus Nucleicultricaceae bacterium]
MEYEYEQSYNLLIHFQGPHKYAAMKTEPRMRDKEDEVLRMDAFVLSKLQGGCAQFCTLHDFALSPNNKFT